MIIILPTIIDKISTLKDGSLKITVVTQELKPEEMAILFEYRNKQVYTAFKEAPINADELDIKETLTEFKTDKTPSQRLRNTLYKYWEKYKPTDDFDTYYKRKMNEIIEYIKEKLN